MQGITLAQQGHIVNAIPPQDAAGTATGDRFSMANWRHASIIVSVGASAAAPTILVKECTAASGGTATAIAFDYFAETTAAGDTLGTLQSATTAGIAGSANDNIFYVIELDARELSDGSPWVEVSVVVDSADAVDVCAIAVLTGGRFLNDQTATVLS